MSHKWLESCRANSTCFATVSLYASGPTEAQHSNSLCHDRCSLGARRPNLACRGRVGCGAESSTTRPSVSHKWFESCTATSLYFATASFYVANYTEAQCSNSLCHDRCSLRAWGGAVTRAHALPPHPMLCGRAADLLAQASASFPPSICHSLAYGSVPMSRESHALAHDVEHTR